MNLRLGIIGFGRMTEALVKGALRADAIKQKNIRTLARDKHKDARIRRAYGIASVADCAKLSRLSDALLIGVKPFQLRDALEALAPHYRNQPVWTIAAGVRIRFYRRFLGGKAPVVRLMPNLPAGFGAGACGVFFPRGIKPVARRDCLAFFRSTGLVVELERESLLDAVLAVSASGPAFAYRFAQAVAEAGAALGLKRETSDALARRMLFGASVALAESGENAEKLIARVASPRGTTLAGLTVLDKKGFTSTVRACMVRAAEKARELGREAEGR